MADTGLLDFGRPDTPPRPRAERERRPLVGGRAPIARQASADGAALNAPNREHQVGQLLRYIEAQGMRGATDAEIERDLKWPVNVVTARRNDLIADGHVVARWPEPRRRSVRTSVMVVVWVATSVVRATLPAIEAGGGPCVRVSRPEADGERSGRSLAVAPIEPPADLCPMTLEQIKACASGTRVRLLDGLWGQARGVVNAQLCVYVFKARGFRMFEPEALVDCRAIDGELRQSKECV